jgi:hypothetical protein
MRSPNFLSVSQLEQPSFRQLTVENIKSQAADAANKG